MVGRRATRVRSLLNVPTRGLAARARRPPHMVGRRATRVRSLANIPTRRARCASAPTSPHGGEASYASSIFTERPHPAGSLRERADLPTWWGGESQGVLRIL